MKTIETAQQLFREGDKDQDKVLDYGTLSELADQGLVDFVLGKGTKQGYLFEAAPSATTPKFLWMAVAKPVRPTDTGDRYFATNQEGVIFYTTAGPFRLDTTGCAIPAGAKPVGR